MKIDRKYMSPLYCPKDHPINYHYEFWPENELNEEQQREKYKSLFIPIRGSIVIVWTSGHPMLILRSTKADEFEHHRGASYSHYMPLTSSESTDMGNKLMELSRRTPAYRKITL